MIARPWYVLSGVLGLLACDNNMAPPPVASAPLAPPSSRTAAPPSAATPATQCTPLALGAPAELDLDGADERCFAVELKARKEVGVDLALPSNGPGVHLTWVDPAAPPSEHLCTGFYTPTTKSKPGCGASRIKRDGAYRLIVEPSRGATQHVRIVVQQR